MKCINCGTIWRIPVQAPPTPPDSGCELNFNLSTVKNFQGKNLSYERPRIFLMKIKFFRQKIKEIK